MESLETLDGLFSPKNLLVNYILEVLPHDPGPDNARSFRKLVPCLRLLNGEPSHSSLIEEGLVEVRLNVGTLMMAAR